MELNRKKNFSKEVIREVVSEVESGASRREVSERRGIAFSTVCAWVRDYGSEEFHRRARPRFAVQERRAIVRKILGGMLTIHEAAIAYRVTKHSVKYWIKESKRDNPDIDLKQSMAATPKDIVQEDLEKARLKILALETMIDVAEQEFKIKIRKKSGAKQ